MVEPATAKTATNRACVCGPWPGKTMPEWVEEGGDDTARSANGFDRLAEDVADGATDRELLRDHLNTVCR